MFTWQDKARPRPFSDVNRMLRKELGLGAADLFAEFDQLPTAAASLGQVRQAL
jgi:predicted unusual protein kinase regulating ubiquinone biosynthesis (AarF/ABC1/UbiB family)